MKKLFLALVVVATLVLVACNKEKEENKANAEQDTQEIIETTTEAEVPEFNSEKLEEFIEAYDSYIEEYKEIVKSKDMNKFQNLSKQGQELAQKAQELTAGGLSQSDAEKLSKYMEEKSEELQELAQKMMQ